MHTAVHLLLALVAGTGLAALNSCDDSSSGGGAAPGGTTSATTTAGAGGQGASGAGGQGAAAQGGSAQGGAGGAPLPTLDCTLAWSSGFENGFPGEWLNYDNGSWSPDGTMPSGRVSAWTIVDSASGEPIYEGNHAYKGWIVGPANESHRAYPGIHTDIETPLVNTFLVYLEADYGAMTPSQWIHFGTWGNHDGQGNGVWALHTMAMRDRKLEFAHTDPFLGQYIGPEPQPDFPTGRWVRFTMYIHYEGTTGHARLWQDGVAVLRADVAQLSNHPGTALRFAHWGMYASSDVSQGVQYNDAIRLWTLETPLTDWTTEPDCHLGD